MATYEHVREERRITVCGAEVEAAYAADQNWREVEAVKELTPKERLQADAAALGLDTSGTVADLTARIDEHQAKLADLQKQADELDLDTTGSVDELQARIDAKLAETPAS